MLNGIIIINKDAGMTSFDVVFRLRKLYGQKKIGHTGTLDPDAVGVLPVCLGKGTKIVEFLTNETKTYEAVMQLGIVTDTQDTSGTVLEKNEVHLSPREIQKVLYGFMGEQQQLPPMYSAVKVNGRKLVDLARKGIEIERKPRKVCFSQLVIKDIRLPYVTFEVTCSKGAYIRTLCHDAGEKLGCGAAMAHLTRTRVGSFLLENSITLSELSEMTMEERTGRLLPVDSVFENLKCVISADEREDRELLNGHSLHRSLPEASDGEEIRIYSSCGEFIGLYRCEKENNELKLVKFFYDLS